MRLRDDVATLKVAGVCFVLLGLVFFFAGRLEFWGDAGGGTAPGEGTEKPRIASGTFKLPSFTAMLKSSRPVLVSVVIEYDRSALSRSLGRDTDRAREKAYFETHQGRFEDAIIGEFGVVDPSAIQTRGGVQDLKYRLVSSMNQMLAVREYIVEDVFFDDLLIMPKIEKDPE